LSLRREEKGIFAGEKRDLKPRIGGKMRQVGGRKEGEEVNDCKIQRFFSLDQRGPWGVGEGREKKERRISINIEGRKFISIGEVREEEGGKTIFAGEDAEGISYPLWKRDMLRGRRTEEKGTEEVLLCLEEKKRRILRGETSRKKRKLQHREEGR